MSDDTPTQRYPAGGEPVPPPGANPPGAVPPTAPLPGEATSPAGATEPLAPGSDTPTELYAPPPPPPGTPGTGAGDEPPPEKKSKALLITLISIGAALLLAIIILLILLFTGDDGGGGADTPSATPTSESPTPTPTPTPTETEEPVVPGPAIANYSAAPTTVDCTAGGTVIFHVAWQATGTTLWFGVGTDDASAEPYGTFPLNHEMDFNYECGQPDSQQRYTITVQGENGEKTSQTIVIQETA